MSSEDLQNDLLSSKEAGKLLGYTHDYISKLCREGKMSGTQKGRIWYITHSELLAFKARHEAELESKKAQLSQKFSQIRSHHEHKRKNKTPQSLTHIESQDATAPATTNLPTSPEGLHVEPQVCISQKPKISQMFSLPREIIAACVLTLLVLTPSFISAVIDSHASDQPAVVESSVDLNETINDGITTVIEAQSEIVEQTIDTYGFVSHLNQGYLQLATSSVTLGKGAFNIIKGISDGYIALYLFQGQAVYESLLQAGDTGMAVLIGYELVGESFVEGGRQTIEYYSQILDFGQPIETTKKKLNSFAINTLGGFEFARAEVQKTLWGEVRSHVLSARDVVVENIANNMVSVSSTFKNASSHATATIKDAFSFSFEQPQENLIKVESEQ